MLTVAFDIWMLPCSIVVVVVVADAATITAVVATFVVAVIVVVAVAANTMRIETHYTQRSPTAKQ